MVFGFYVPRIVAANYWEGQGEGKGSVVCVCVLRARSRARNFFFCSVQVHEICLYFTIGYFENIKLNKFS